VVMNDNMSSRGCGLALPMRKEIPVSIQPRRLELLVPLTIHADDISYVRDWGDASCRCRGMKQRE
jgi:hypothetical protein